MNAKVSDEEILVDEGDSSQPFFSASGSRLLFVSARRPHAQPQAYEKTLETGEERRLTFSNGAVINPKYHPTESWIVYASTTDELKENPPLLYPHTEVSKLPAHLREPTEIYIHSLDGLEITRVTDRLGYDGDPQFSFDGRQLVWTRAVKDRTEVVALNRQSKSLQTLRKLGTNPAGYIATTDRNHNAWIDWDQAFSFSRVWLKSGKAAPVEINAEHQVTKADLVFSPDNKYLAWSQYNALGQRFEIWVYSLDTKCAHMLVGSESADRRHPAFSPDMSKIAFSLIKGERSRIAALPWAPPTGPCSSAE